MSVSTASVSNTGHALATARHTDGAQVCADLTREVDVVIVGSGPAGAAAAWGLTRVAGPALRVLVIEAGPLVPPSAFPAPAFDAMADLYRGMSATVVLGKAPIPYVQGRMVGGSSPVNGAICWRTPRDVWEAWVAADPALAEAWPWEALEEATDAVEARLHVAPTDPHDPIVAGAKSRLMAAGAEALGLDHRPIRRNVEGCQGLGRCLQGCPGGHKLSVDRTLLADAMTGGVELLSNVRVEAVTVEGGRPRKRPTSQATSRAASYATGVVGRAAGGGRVQIRAGRVVLAASAVQSPALLLASGITGGPVGRNFQCHPGVSMAGRFREPVRMWEGATQGYEVTGLRRQGLKFESLGFGLSMLAARIPGAGQAWAREIARLDRYLDWGAAVKAEARGRVRVFRGRPVVWFKPTRRDVALFRRGLRVMGEMMLAAGAEVVMPGVKGFTAETSSVAELERLEAHGPTSAGPFTAVITHMFGTCRAGSDPAGSVVRPDLRHHHVDGLYVVDSSVFPTNLGVNPQVAIMALATLGARSVLASLGEEDSP